MFYSQPPTYSAITKKLKSLKRTFASIKMRSIGASVLGRRIHGIFIGDHKSSIKPILLVGGVHAQEWLTSSLLVQFCEDLAQSIADGQECQQPFIVIPMLNPDGVEIALHGSSSAMYLSRFVEHISTADSRSWQANARGIDLNHNFDAGFSKLQRLEHKAGIFSPSPRQYGGKRPHSEPENIAIVRLLREINCKLVIAFHSQGEEIFSEYEGKRPTDTDLYEHILKENTGYKLVENDGLYSYGGLKDYVIDKLDIPSFTLEVGKGTNPLPIEDLPVIYPPISKALFALSRLD